VLGGLDEVFLAYRKSREMYDPRQAGLGQDRRIFYRVTLKVVCRMLSPMFGLETSGTTVDVSLNGVGVIVPANWAEGNRIRVRIDDIKFEADGIIVFRKEEEPQFRYGVRFQNTGIFQILKLRRFLQGHHSGRLSQ
jgi:hypothetical protein